MKRIVFVLAALVIGISSPQLFAENENANSELVIKKESETVKIRVTGMTCGGCASSVSSAIKDVEGVIDQKLKFPGDVATVEYNPEETSEEAIIEAIEEVGYKAEVLKEDDKENKTGEKKACQSSGKGCCAGDKDK